MRDILGRIDWQVFFAGLFILIAGLAKTGLLVSFADWLAQQLGGNMILSVTLVL